MRQREHRIQKIPDVTGTLTPVPTSKYLGNVNNEIAELRLASNLSQASLASVMRVSLPTIDAIETGRYEPSLGLAIRMAQYLNRPVEEVFHVETD